MAIVPANLLNDQLNLNEQPECFGYSVTTDQIQIQLGFDHTIIDSHDFYIIFQCFIFIQFTDIN